MHGWVEKGEADQARAVARQVLDQVDRDKLSAALLRHLQRLAQLDAGDEQQRGEAGAEAAAP